MNIKKHKLALAIHLACLPVLALAADDTTSPADDESVERIQVQGRYTVNETIDTATGLGLTLMETPQSVSVITSQRIQDQGLSSIDDVVVQTTGLSAKAFDSTRNTFSARGFDIDKYQIDGVPLAWSLAGDSGETITDVAIYDRIEVVRGATGLLTGVGEPSASINLVRKHANSHEFTGYVNGGFGSWNRRHVTADISTPLVSDGSVRTRVVVKKETGDHFQDLSQNDKTVLYGVIDADLTQHTSFSAGSSYQDNSPTASTWGALPPLFSDGTPTDWERSTTTAAEWTRWDSTSRNHFANLIHQFNQDWQLRLSYNHTKNTADTRLLYIYGEPDRDSGVGLIAMPYNSDGFSKQNSFDLQLQGLYRAFGQEHEVVVGALSSKQESEVLVRAPLSSVEVGNFYQWDGRIAEPEWSASPTLDVQLDTRQSGVYAATRISLTDSVKLIAGGRFTDWEREGINYSEQLNFSDTSFVPYVGVTYQLNDQHIVYASHTEIFMPQNAYDRNRQFLDSVEGSNQEVGIKSSYLDGALQTSFALFRIQQDNLAQPDIAYQDPGNNFFPSFAAQGAESKGFEVEVLGQLLPNWNVSVGYAQFTAEDQNGIDINPSHPRKNLTVFTTYEFEHGLPGLVIGGGFTYESETFGDAIPWPGMDESYRIYQAGFTLANLMARYHLTEQLALQLNVYNLFDKTYYSGLNQQYNYGAPRNIRLTANWSF